MTAPPEEVNTSALAPASRAQRTTLAVATTCALCRRPALSIRHTQPATCSTASALLKQVRMMSSVVWSVPASPRRT